MKLRESYYQFKPNFIFCIAQAVYIILFVTIMRPNSFFGINWSDGWSGRASLCLLVIASICLVVLLISRSLFCFLPFSRSLGKAEYYVWMFVELAACSLFVDLFLSIFLSKPYFELLPKILFQYTIVSIIPCLVYWLAMYARDLNAQLTDAQAEIAELRKGAERNEAGMIRFNDEKGNTKLVVSAERVVSLESAGNYVNILYDDGGKLVRYSLRNTLKGIENVCSANGLVRCHRSYLVNLNKIKIIRRTSDGVFAEMDVPNLDHIPVSKTYAPELLKLFSEN